MHKNNVLHKLNSWQTELFRKLLRKQLLMKHLQTEKPLICKTCKMKYLSALFMVLIMLVKIGGVTRVKYCDGVYQLINRSDESEQVCGVEDTVLGESKVNLNLHSPCLSDEEGLLCADECIPYQSWCSSGTEFITNCGLYLQSPSVCRNNTFWESKTCGKEGKRCTGWWPGECNYGDGCQDGSELV